MGTIKRLFALGFLLIASGCVGTTPLDAPKKGFYENKPVVFSAPYDRVWEATLQAVSGLGWDVKSADEARGVVRLAPSYVYNPSFGEYKRIYREPTREEAKNSKIKPYLRRISYYEKNTPMNPLFVREDMTIEVKSLSSQETQVKVNYKITPYYDYTVGYVGTIGSKGRVEKALFKKIGELVRDAGRSG
jgi:hypothetical protein